MNSQEISKALKNIDKVKILVVGDLALDHYISGEIKRLNPEEFGAPLLDVTKHFDIMGCAANTANNIHAIGAESYLYAVIGDDNTGKVLLNLLTSNGINPRIMTINGKITPKKTRLISSTRKRQIARYDEELKTQLTEKQTQDFINSFSEKELDECQVYIVSDYAKGLINKKIIDFLKKQSQKRKKIFIAQPKPSNFMIFKGVDMMINIKEAKEIAGINNNLSIEQIGKKIVKTNKSNLIITYGKEGMGFFARNGDYKYVPTKPIEAFDETGAGDTALSVLCIGLALKLKIQDSMDLANHAAGIVVKKMGTSILTKQELIESYD